MSNNKVKFGALKCEICAKNGCTIITKNSGAQIGLCCIACAEKFWSVGK